MAIDSLKKALLRWLPVIVIGTLLLISLSVLYQVLQESASEQQTSDVQSLLYLNAGILFLLSTAILFNLIRVIYQWHTRQAGSRFTLRLMAGFLALTLLPVLVVSVFAMNLIGKSINMQLDERVQRALDDAVELSEKALLIRSRIQLQHLSLLAEQLPGKNRLEMVALMDDWRGRSGAYEVVLLGEDMGYVTNSTDGIDELIPLFTGSDLLNKLSGRNALYQIETLGTPDAQDAFSRVALRVNYGINNEPGILTALFQFPAEESSLSENVSLVSRDYKGINFQRDLFKKAFRGVLLLAIVLSVLFALWAAFIFSRRLTRPVRDLVEGTLAVASGDLQKKLPVSDRDDFSLLARSFNAMTKRLSHVQNEREQARHQLQQEHDYLDVVLGHLSSGVVTLDENRVIRRVNASAAQILGQPLDEQVGSGLEELCTGRQLQPFLQALQPWLDDPEQDWQAEVDLMSDGRRKVLMCRGASLPTKGWQQQGYVLVFEDVSDVVQAEHDAAWGEVARRLAHEIKNPLTPIQLSAERLTRKLSRFLEDEEQAFLKRMTDTIIQQVDTLKSMVNAFSEYAKAPVLMLQPVMLNDLVTEVAELYRGNAQEVEIALDLQPLPRMALDPHRIRQLLVNLIKNALEAIEPEPGAGMIRISSTLEQDSHRAGAQQVVLNIQDSGPGIPENLLPHLFEPYVTSKHKGTGLGLAIVKKIVEEHDGSLSARNAQPKGAIITVRLPVHDVSAPEDKEQ
ncbi:MAG: ATP-binding protein [Thiolinea sp.]